MYQGCKIFLQQHTKTGKNYQITMKYTKGPKIYQMTINIPNGHEILQDPPKSTQIWMFGLKIYHLATLVCMDIFKTFFDISVTQVHTISMQIKSIFAWSQMYSQL
jgi:hypothetical protein